MPIEPRIIAAFDRTLARYAPDKQPGGTVAIYQDGHIAYECGFGYAHLEHAICNTPQTRFHIASLSKQFTAMAMALAAREYSLSLDDNVQALLPELSHLPPITYRQIMHHTSGLRDQWDLLRLAGWRAADLKTTADILALAERQTRLNFPPGERFQYINTGYTLLSIVIERIAGRSFAQYTQSRLFEPLGMSDSFFLDDHERIIPHRAQAYALDNAGQLKIHMPAYETAGPTGLFSTVRDFAHWERNFLQPTVGDATLMEQMRQPGSRDGGHPTSYGFGLLLGRYRGLDIIEHAGGDAGYRAHYLRFPTMGLAIAAFCNSAQMKPAALARELMDIYFADRPGTFHEDAHDTSGQISRAAGVPVPMVERDAELWVGLYRDVQSGNAFRIEWREGCLFLLAAGGAEYPLMPTGADQFAFQNVEGAACAFQRPTDSEPLKLVVTYAGEVTACCERLANAPSDTNLDGYEGTFHSAELGTHYTIRRIDRELTLHRPKVKPSVLQTLSEDEFSVAEAGIHLHFQRDKNRHVCALLATTERVWGVTFERVQ